MDVLFASLPQPKIVVDTGIESVVVPAVVPVAAGKNLHFFPMPHSRWKR